MDTKVMQNKAMREHDFDVPAHICWKATKIMKAMLGDKHENGYNCLPQYTKVFMEKNPGSLCVVNWLEQDPPKILVFNDVLFALGQL